MFLRPAEPDDAMAVARVHVRTWQAAYRTLLPDEYLDGLQPEDRAKRYDFATTDATKPRTIVAIEDGVVCGFATTAPARDPDMTGHGELYALYVDPAHWGTGMGTALVSAARDRLSRLGFSSAVLWVLENNSRADRFYRMDGWVADGSRRTAEVWGVTVNELRYRRPLGKP